MFLLIQKTLCTEKRDINYYCWHKEVGNPIPGKNKPRVFGESFEVLESFVSIFKSFIRFLCTKMEQILRLAKNIIIGLRPSSSSHRFLLSERRDVRSLKLWLSLKYKIRFNFHYKLRNK